ncbi:MAG: DUF3050 domain-containing protein, partial [Planctomycetaceae bacterium]
HRSMPNTVVPPPVSRRTIDLDDARERLVRHRIYGLVNSADRLRRFMESHVFAVWDFQSLLKAMQQRLTCTIIPWVPTADPEARRLVNEIVLDEESDALPEGGAASHFELYLDGMRAAGADTGPIDRMIAVLQAGQVPQVGKPAATGNLAATGTPAATIGETVAQAMQAAGAPEAARRFVGESFDVIESGSTHGIVAAFTYGREDVIPEMFRGLVSSLAARDPAWARFHWYLERHIEADDEKHAPICRRIIARLCGDDAEKWAEASAVARRCLEARIALWDAIAAEIETLPAG